MKVTKKIYKDVTQHADSPNCLSKYIPNTPEIGQQLIKAITEAYDAGSLFHVYMTEKPKQIQRGSVYWVFYSSNGLYVAIGRAQALIIDLSNNHSIDLNTLRYYCLTDKNICVIEIPLLNRDIPRLLTLTALSNPELGVTFDSSIIKLPNGHDKEPISAEEFFKLDAVRIGIGDSEALKAL